MHNESNDSEFVNDLDGHLRHAVDLVCAADLPRDRMEQCLERTINALPIDAPADNSRTVRSESKPANRRRWIGFAAAAAVVTALIVSQFGSPPNSLADVVRAISRQPWIHITESATDGEREVWYSTSTQRSATRRADWIAYHDHKLRIYHSYDVAEGVLYRVPEIGTDRQDRPAGVAEILPLLLADGIPPDDPLSKMEFLQNRSLELKLLQQKLEKVTDNGRDWLEYKLTVRMGDEEQPVEAMFRVDPQTKLVYLNRVTGRHKGKAFRYEATYDYPESGPPDIYAIGVPRDAKLVDRVPTDDVARVIAGVESGRSRFDDFRAIVVKYREGGANWWREHPEVIHRKGNRMRRDLGFHQESSAVEPSADVDHELWWKERATQFRYFPSSIYIAGTHHAIRSRTITKPDGTIRRELDSVQSFQSGLNAEQWVPACWSVTPDYVVRPPLGVPNQHMEPVVDTDATGGPEGTILLQVRRTGRIDAAHDPDADKRPSQPGEFHFWIDPTREQIVMRMDMMGANDNVGTSYIVEAVAQSPQGHWYATRVRRTASGGDGKDQIMEYYVQFDVEIPDAIFDLKEPLPVEKTW